MEYYGAGAILCTGLFAGAAAYITLVEHPARMQCGTVLAATEFVPSYRRATVMQASLAAIALTAALLAWRASGVVAWLVGGCVIGSVIPFTLLFILPTNKRILALNPGSDQTRALLIRWGHLHAVRTVFSLTGFVIFLLAPSSGESVIRAREAVLRQDLFQLNSLLSQFTLDKQKAPRSLEDLVTAGYLKKLPLDPMTGAVDWVAEQEDVRLSPDQRDPGISSVHSPSTQIGTDGRAYNHW